MCSDPPFGGENWQCEICGVVAHKSTMYWSWGGSICASNPECRAPFGPRRRPTFDLDVKTLDAIETDADIAYATLQDVEIAPNIVFALVELARRHVR